MADRMVAQGTDVADLTTFVKTLDEHYKGIKIIVVEKETIENESKNPGIKFKGTIKVHQVNWYRTNSVLKFRHQSCFDCRDSRTICKHFELAKTNVKNECIYVEVDPVTNKNKKKLV